MTEAEYALYTEIGEAIDNLPPLSAIAYLEQAVVQHDESTVALARLAWHAALTGRREYAGQACKRLLAKGRTAWSVAVEAFLQMEAGDSARAMELAAEAVRLDESNPMALDVACSVALLRGLFDQAHAMAHHRYLADPADPEAYYDVVAVAILERDFEAATRLMARAPHEFVGTAAYHLAAGYIAQHDRRYEDAVIELRSATDKRPNRPFPWVKLGIALFKLNRIPEAKAAISRALELNPRHGLALSLSAKIADKEGNFIERDRLLHDARRHSGAVKSFRHVDAADELVRAGFPREALRALEMMGSEGDYEARQLAVLKKLAPLADLGRWNEVEEALSLLRKNPANPSLATVGKARLIASRSNVRGAIDLLDEAFAALPEDGQVLRWLLIYASESGDYTCLKRVADLGQEHLSGTDTGAFNFVCALYGVKAFDLGDRVLADAVGRFPASRSLLAVQAWRCRRVGDAAGANKILATLPAKWRYWKPPSTLRPPEQTFWHVQGRLIRRMFLRY